MAIRAKHGSFWAKPCLWPVHSSASPVLLSKSFYITPWLLVLCCLLYLSVFRLSSATIAITSTNECALRTAISQAASGDTIQIDLHGFAPTILTNIAEDGTETYLTNFPAIVLTNGPLVINKDLTIIGATNQPVIDGQWLTRVFTINTGRVTLCSLSIKNGDSTKSVPQQGAAIYNTAELTVSNCIFTGNQSYTEVGMNSSGGAILNEGRLTVQNSGFTNNGSSASGGALFNKGNATIKGSSFSFNYAGWQGGAIDNLGSLTLSDSTLSENFAKTYGGGGLGNQSNGVACINNCKFYLNTNLYYGGGGIINLGSLVMTNSQFVGNQAEDDSNDDELAGGGGGGLFNFGGVASLTWCVLGPTNNAKRGGGILNLAVLPSEPSLLVMNSCTIYNNEVSLYGGGLMNWADGGPATSSLTNCTVSFNYVDLQDYTAGGLDNSAYMDSATINLMNCTVASNRLTWIKEVSIAGGILSGTFGDDASAQAEVKIANSILCGDIKPKQGETVGRGKLTSCGYNVISDNNTLLTTTNATDFRNRTPGLTPLLEAGPIRAHFITGNFSPAIDGGNPTNSPAFDARGRKRPFGRGYDIGAIEQILEFLPFTTNNFAPNPPLARYYVDLKFTPYMNPGPYIIEYARDCSPTNWQILASVNYNPTLINLITYRHNRGGPVIATNTAYFYRVRQGSVAP